MNASILHLNSIFLVSEDYYYLIIIFNNNNVMSNREVGKLRLKAGGREVLMMVLESFVKETLLKKKNKGQKGLTCGQKSEATKAWICVHYGNGSRGQWQELVGCGRRGSVGGGGTHSITQAGATGVSQSCWNTDHCVLLESVMVEDCGYGG